MVAAAMSSGVSVCLSATLFKCSVSDRAKHGGETSPESRPRRTRRVSEGANTRPITHVGAKMQYVPEEE